MMCYKDMTWCPFFGDCKKANECDRPLTAEVIIAAKAWWGKDDPPICVFTEKPSCHEPLTQENNEDASEDAGT